MLEAQGLNRHAQIADIQVLTNVLYVYLSELYRAGIVCSRVNKEVDIAQKLIISNIVEVLACNRERAPSGFQNLRRFHQIGQRGQNLVESALFCMKLQQNAYFRQRNVAAIDPEGQFLESAAGDVHRAALRQVDQLAGGTQPGRDLSRGQRRPEPVCG